MGLRFWWTRKATHSYGYDAHPYWILTNRSSLSGHRGLRTQTSYNLESSAEPAHISQQYVPSKLRHLRQVKPVSRIVPSDSAMRPFEETRVDFQTCGGECAVRIAWAADFFCLKVRYLCTGTPVVIVLLSSVKAHVYLCRLPTRRLLNKRDSVRAT